MLVICADWEHPLPVPWMDTLVPYVRLVTTALQVTCLPFP